MCICKQIYKKQFKSLFFIQIFYLLKGELTNFFFIFVFLRSSIINFTPKIFHSKNVFNLMKSAVVFSETKVLPKILSEHIRFTNLHTGGSTGPFMTSYLPFTDIRESCLYAFGVNTHI